MNSRKTDDSGRSSLNNSELTRRSVSPLLLPPCQPVSELELGLDPQEEVIINRFSFSFNVGGIQKHQETSNKTKMQMNEALKLITDKKFLLSRDAQLKKQQSTVKSQRTDSSTDTTRTKEHTYNIIESVCGTSSSTESESGTEEVLKLRGIDTFKTQSSSSQNSIQDDRLDRRIAKAESDIRKLRRAMKQLLKETSGASGKSSQKKKRSKNGAGGLKITSQTYNEDEESLPRKHREYRTLKELQEMYDERIKGTSSEITSVENVSSNHSVRKKRSLMSINDLKQVVDKMIAQRMAKTNRRQKTSVISLENLKKLSHELSDHKYDE